MNINFNLNINIDTTFLYNNLVLNKQKVETIKVKSINLQKSEVKMSKFDVTKEPFKSLNKIPYEVTFDDYEIYVKKGVSFNDSGEVTKEQDAGILTKLNTEIKAIKQGDYSVQLKVYKIVLKNIRLGDKIVRDELSYDTCITDSSTPDSDGSVKFSANFNIDVNITYDDAFLVAKNTLVKQIVKGGEQLALFKGDKRISLDCKPSKFATTFNSYYYNSYDSEL